MTVGDRLAKLRELAKMGQRDVAQAVGVERPTVSSWETNRRMPSRKYLYKLANLFRVSVDYILGFEAEGESLPRADASGRHYVSGVVLLPVYGSVGPGSGGLSHNRIVGQEVVAVDEVRDGHYFFFRVSGDSMKGDIKDGYVALVKEGEDDLEDGDVILVSVNANDAILRRYRRGGAASGTIVLQADNPEYPPIVVLRQNAHIVGKVIWVKFKA